MEQQALADYNDDIRNRLLDVAGFNVGDVTDLEGFENYVYGADEYVVRITHDSHRTVAQLDAEIQFVRALADEGAAVAAPVALPGGEWLHSYGSFHVCRFQRARGERVTEFDADLVQRWGLAIAEFHRVSAGLDLNLARDDWRLDANHQFAKRIPLDQTLVLNRAEEMMEELGTLPCGANVYGLIHSDAHWGNFLVDGDQLTFFDFDDSLYCWFGYDLATILLGATLQPWVPETPAAETRAAEGFLDAFLEGYGQVAAIENLMLEKMLLLIRLREFSLYAVIHAHANLGDNPFAQRFLRGRRERLETNQPFVELDVTRWV